MGRAKAVVILLLTIPAGLRAETAEMHYEVTWGGMRAAEAALVRSDDHAHLGIATTGIADSLAGLRMQLDSSRHRDWRFDVDSQGARSESRLALEFPGAALPPRLVIDETHPSRPDDDDPRPPVPPRLQVGAIDPLRALLEAGRRAAAAPAGGPRQFTLAVYDGHQRYDVQLTVTGWGATEVADRRVNAISVQAVVTPIAGFRPATLETWRGASFEALIDPASGLPLRIASRDFTIDTVITAETADRP